MSRVSSSCACQWPNVVADSSAAVLGEIVVMSLPNPAVLTDCAVDT